MWEGIKTAAAMIGLAVLGVIGTVFVVIWTVFVAIAALIAWTVQVLADAGIKIFAPGVWERMEANKRAEKATKRLRRRMKIARMERRRERRRRERTADADSRTLDGRRRDIQL